MKEVYLSLAVLLCGAAIFMNAHSSLPESEPAQAETIHCQDISGDYLFVQNLSETKRMVHSLQNYLQDGSIQIQPSVPDDAETVLFSRYRDTGKARVFILTGEAITEVTGRPPVPYTPPRTQFLTAEGDVIDAPSFKAPGRAGR